MGISFWRRKSVVFAAAVITAVVAVACVPPPSDPGSPPTTLVPLPDPPAELSVLSYNVAGLPQGISGSNPQRNLPLISPLLNDYDVVLTQEDFDWWQPILSGSDFANYHQRLHADATHPYRSDVHPGPAAVGINASTRPLFVGDGIGLMARFPLTDESVHPWPDCFGGILPPGSSDCLSMKGFRVMTMTLGDGRLVDVYSLHAEAGGTDRDQALQVEDFEELATVINARPSDRAVIVGGDTNLHIAEPHPDAQLDGPIYDEFLAATGLRDVCAELSCGDDARIDKFAYRSSPTVGLTATSWSVPSEQFSTPEGADLSDHLPVVATFRWDVPAG